MRTKDMHTDRQLRALAQAWKIIEAADSGNKIEAEVKINMTHQQVLSHITPYFHGSKFSPLYRTFINNNPPGFTKQWKIIGGHILKKMHELYSADQSANDARLKKKREAKKLTEKDLRLRSVDSIKKKTRKPVKPLKKVA